MNVLKVTASDVAAAAGVSPSTVSRALRNHPRLSPATRERVRALAESMGYRPDPLISALLARRFRKGGAEIGTIAYVTAFASRDGWKTGSLEEFYEGAKRYGLSQGYRVEHFWLREAKMTGRRLSEVLRARGIQGMILAPLPHGYGHLRMKWEHFSCAAIGYSMIRPSLHRATPHHFHNTLLALRSLRQAGHRKIGVILTSNTNRKVGENYLAAALMFRQHYGKQSLSVLMIKPQPKTLPYAEHGRLARLEVEAWLKKNRLDCLYAPPTFLIWDLSLPKELFVALQNELPETNYAHIDEKAPLVGATAVDLIIGQIQRHETGIPTDPKVVMVEGRWNN